MFFFNRLKWPINIVKHFETKDKSLVSYQRLFQNHFTNLETSFFLSHFKSIEKNMKNQQKKHVPGLPSCSWNCGNFSKATEAMASQKGTSRLAQVARPARKMLSTWRYNEILLDRIDNTQYTFNKQIKTKQNKERERDLYIVYIYNKSDDLYWGYEEI